MFMYVMYICLYLFVVGQMNGMNIEIRLPFIVIKENCSAELE